MRAFWAMTLAEFKLNTRNIVFLVFALVTPLLMLFLLGSLYADDPDAGVRLFEGYGVVQYSLPAFIGLSLAIRAFTGMPQQLVSYKENKVLKRLKATPLKVWQIFIPIFLNYLFLFFIGLVLLLVSAVLFFDVTLAGNFFGFMLALFLSVTALFSFGVFLSCVCKSVKQVTAIGFGLLVPMILFSGATMPTSALDNEIIITTAKLMPLTQCIKFMRGMFLGLPFSDYLTQFWVLTGMTAVFTLLSFWLFKWE